MLRNQYFCFCNSGFLLNFKLASEEVSDIWFSEIFARVLKLLKDFILGKLPLKWWLKIWNYIIFHWNRENYSLSKPFLFHFHNVFAFRLLLIFSKFLTSFRLLWILIFFFSSISCSVLCIASQVLGRICHVFTQSHSRSWVIVRSPSCHLLFLLTILYCDDSFLVLGTEPAGDTCSRSRGHCRVVHHVYSVRWQCTLSECSWTV